MLKKLDKIVNWAITIATAAGVLVQYLIQHASKN